MAAPAAIFAVEAAIAVVVDKRGRTVITSAATAVLLSFVLVIVVLLSIMDRANSHNVSTVAQVFWERTIPSRVPREYRRYIVGVQISFTSLENLIADVNHVEDREPDVKQARSIFYTMCFDNVQSSLLAQKEFVDCFTKYEEREDGGDDSYAATIPITDLDTVYANMRQRLDLGIGVDQKTNAQRIYTVAVYGPTVPGGMAAGSTMGDRGYQALLTKAAEYIGSPHRWGGSDLQMSFDCSGYICWIYTRSGAYQLPRIPAQGIFDRCVVIPREETKPGDLIFFTKTCASSTPVSHVGLYIGGDRMLYYEDPIGYANIDSNYWRSHFYTPA